MRLSFLLPSAAALALVLPACGDGSPCPGDLEPIDDVCQCPEDTRLMGADQCVEIESDAGTPDAYVPPRMDSGTDAGTDAGPPDSGPEDAGPPDANCPDTVWYRDMDRDDFGDPDVTMMGGCTAPDGYVADDTDCNDDCASCRPFGTETCDELDNDCDEETDEGLPQITCYRDFDRDGYGVEDRTMRACGCFDQWTDRDDVFDCNDHAVNAFPGQTEFFVEPYCEDPNGLCLRDDGFEWGFAGTTWDYDCDGEEVGRWNERRLCTLSSSGSGECFAIFYPGPQDPSCGETIEPITSCDYATCDNRALSERRQACR